MALKQYPYEWAQGVDQNAAARDAFSTGYTTGLEAAMEWIRQQDDTGFGGTMDGDYLAHEFQKEFCARAVADHERSKHEG
jgi:hypothetical protein